ncbi:hypothetical protein [Streptomyces sp. NPDC058955]|uniref:hypothetical protein n=1 Tax=unclassified Streptomyces TaxID=2593676 RepID=UPI003663ECBE
MARDLRPAPPGPGPGPDPGRPDAAAVFVTRWYVPGRADGTRLLDEIATQWRTAAPPDGLLSFHAYLSTDEDTVLTYVQARDPAVYRPFVRSLRGAARAEPVEYRPDRGVVLASSARPPGCAVVASFDVDGAERQDRIVDSVLGALDDTPAAGLRGMLSAHFHLSTDGSRVLNFARWTSDEAHEAFLAGAARRATLRATGATPGVRPVGFQRFHLHHAIDLGRSGTGLDRSLS